MRSTLFLVSVLAIACSSPRDARTPSEAAETDSGRRSEAKTPEEKSLLDQMGQLKVGVKVSLGKKSVLLEPSYTAASGLTCQQVQFLDAAPKTRLVCKDGAGWFFAPPIDGPPEFQRSETPEVEVDPSGAAVAISPKKESVSHSGGAPSGDHP